MNRKQICKVIVFLLLVAVSVTGLNGVLMAKWEHPCYESLTQPGFYEREKNSIEVCVLGSSQVVYGVSGMKMYEDHGISAYNLGSAVQPMAASYMWLKECRKTQDIRLVVLDTSALFENSQSSHYRRAFDNMKFSLDKMKVLWDYSSTREGADPLASFAMQIIKYHTRWDQLQELDFVMDEKNYALFRGYYARTAHKAVSLDKIIYDDDAYDPERKMYDYQVKYLDRIVEYCQEEGLELLLIKTPKDDWDIAKHQLTQEYADEHGLTFLDFSSREMVETLGLVGETDFRDDEHLNFFGAEKLSAWLGDYLAEHYELTDFRDGQEDPEYERYVERREDSRMQLCANLSEYFDYLDFPRYEVLIQLTDNTPQLRSEELAKALQKAGTATDITTLNGLRYMAWLREGECLYEDTAERAFEYSDQFKDGTGFRMMSNFDSSEPRLRLNYEDVIFVRRGLNILVYDNKNHKIADKCTIYYDGASKTLKLAKEEII